MNSRSVPAVIIISLSVSWLTVSTAQPAKSASVTATFIVKNADTQWGQNVYVVGDVATLGKWDVSHGLPLKILGKGKNAVWSGTTTLPAGASVQYKYVKWDGSNAEWEADQPTKSKNREVRIPVSGHVTFDDHSFKLAKPGKARGEQKSTSSHAAK